MPLIVRQIFLVVSLVSLCLGGCGSDDKSVTPSRRPDSDASADAFDSGSDLDSGENDDVGTADDAATQPDSRVDALSDADADNDSGPDVERDVWREPDADADVDAGPLPGQPDDWLCDRAARVSACESLLLDPVEMPMDPAELLFYVNRWYSVPASFPVGDDTTWTPCDGGSADVEHDLVCTPDSANSGPRRALRELAWESEAPTGYEVTYDERPVGFDGRIGFNAMMEAAEAEADVELFIVSGFRSYRTQEVLHESYVDREMGNGYSEEDARIVASTYSARPGHSEHQLGTTADLTYRTESGSIFPGLDQVMGGSRAFQWVFRNAHRFGIVLTYDEHRVVETQYVYEPWHFRFVGVEAADAMRECELNTEEFLSARYSVDSIPDYEGYRFILETAAQLDRHETLAPGSWVRPGTTQTKTWIVRNEGTTNWWNYSLQQVGGRDLGVPPVDVVCVPVGDTTAISVTFDVPDEEGRLEADFAIFDEDANELALDLTVDLNVSNDPPAATPYRWVRIDDLSDATGGGDPGADIDAVLLVPEDRAISYATEVGGYSDEPASVNADNPDDALGEPDAFYDYPNVSVCGVSSGFVSLGGSGFVTVQMDEAIVAGDELHVLEVGGCDYGSGTAIEDLVQISVATDPSGPWIEIGRGIGPQIEAVVPALP